MAFVKLIDNFLEMFPPIMRAWAGIIVIGMMFIMPDVIIALVLIGIFYSMIYSIFHWGHKHVLNYVFRPSII